MTATEKYHERRATIDAQIEALLRMLERHDNHRRFEGRTGDWGYCGDLGYVEDRLGEALKHLGGGNDV
jgi:hypothetical protein